MSNFIALPKINHILKFIAPLIRLIARATPEIEIRASIRIDLRQHVSFSRCLSAVRDKGNATHYSSRITISEVRLTSSFYRGAI